MFTDNDIADLRAHKAQAQARGYSVVPGDAVGKWALMSPLQDYRGTFDSIDDAWRGAPRDRRATPRPTKA